MHRQPTTQYNVEFPNKPGIHAKLVRFLVSKKIDFQSMVTTRLGRKTLMQFLAPRSETFRDQLENLGITVREETVFQLEMPHHHSQLHRLAKNLADKDINVLSLYSMVEGDSMRIVLSVDQPANAVAIIQKLGYKPDYSIYE
ncbi:MAG: hypothetical protein ACHQ49_07505 [Elusimicrobiota bacterium]